MKNKVITFTIVLFPSFRPLLVQLVLVEVLLDNELVFSILRLGHVIHR